MRILGSTVIKEKLFNAGTTVVGSSPPQLAAAVKSEMTVFGKLIKDVGIRAE